jgi:glycosyltransferase involved in cell wall biosynthesis
MNILIITGKLKQGSCGVCDYTNNLYESIKRVNNQNDNTVIMKSVFEIRINDIIKTDVVILNYPCPEYGFSLKPHIMFVLSKLLNKKCIYVMHEFSFINRLRKFSIKPLLLFANKIISVTKEEIGKLKRNIQNKSTFIPIASNFDTSTIISNNNINEFTISYFGVFYPAKKIEYIIDAINILKLKGIKVRLSLIGAEHPKHKNYILALKEKVKSYNLDSQVTFFLNKEEKDVLELLSQSNACVLIFDEGVTMRRSSFLTALELGLNVITTIGRDTPKEITTHKGILLIENIAQLASAVEELVDNSDKYNYIAEVENKKIGLVNWKDIGEMYTSLIEN